MISAGVGRRLKIWIRDRTAPITPAPTAMPYDFPRFASSTGRRSHDRTAVTTTVPRVIAVRETTSSMVMAPDLAGAWGPPCAASGCGAYGLAAYGLAAGPPACGVKPAYPAPAPASRLKPRREKTG